MLPPRVRLLLVRRVPERSTRAEVRCPTLVIHGTRDVEVPFHHGHAVRATRCERTPGARRRIGRKARGTRTSSKSIGRSSSPDSEISSRISIDARAKATAARGRGARREGEPPAMPGGMVAPTPTTTVDESETRAIRSSRRSSESDEEGAEEGEGKKGEGKKGEGKRALVADPPARTAPCRRRVSSAARPISPGNIPSRRTSCTLYDGTFLRANRRRLRDVARLDTARLYSSATLFRNARVLFLFRLRCRRTPPRSACPRTFAPPRTLPTASRPRPPRRRSWFVPPRIPPRDPRVAARANPRR